MSHSIPASHRLTVSVVTGIIVERDAISNVCRQQIEEIENYAKSLQVGLDLKIYVHGYNVMDPRIVKMSHPMELACDAHFQRSDLVIFHFGIFYPLFDAVVMTPRTARLVVNYYGITPPAATPVDSQDVLHRSFRQASQLLNADCVLVNSRFIYDEALSMGVAEERLSVLPLPSAFTIPRQIPMRTPNGPMRITYLGRIVPAKGICELMGAMRRFASDHTFTLTMMGAAQFSCPKLIDQIRTMMNQAPLMGRLELLLDQPGEVIRQRLSETDLFVMPSHHEGFCVPIIEALSCGAGVISSNAGAIPETAGNLGLTFPVGNENRLLNCLERYAAAWADGLYLTDQGRLTPSEWSAQAAQHLDTFRRERFSDNFIRLALTGVETTPIDRSKLLGETRVRAYQQFQTPVDSKPENSSISRHLQRVLAVSSHRRRLPRATRSDMKQAGKEIRS